jgi:hypothetical protein
LIQQIQRSNSTQIKVDFRSEYTEANNNNKKLATKDDNSEMQKDSVPEQLSNNNADNAPSQNFAQQQVYEAILIKKEPEIDILKNEPRSAQKYSFRTQI